MSEKKEHTAFKDNKRQRGQHNAQHTGHQNEHIRGQELEGHRDKQNGHHKPGNHPHLKTSKNEK